MSKTLNQYVSDGVIPDSLGACADLYKEVSALRSAMNKEVEGMKKLEKALEDHLIDNIDKSADEGVIGKKYACSVVSEAVPTAKDWDAIWGYIVSKKRFDLMQKRLSSTAIKDLWADGVEVPGVVEFNKLKLSVTKRKR